LCANLAAAAIANAQLYAELQVALRSLKLGLEQEVSAHITALAQQAIEPECEEMSEDATSLQSVGELLARVIELKIAREVLTKLPSMRLDPPLLSTLTTREAEVLTLLVRGYSNKEIALDLGISVNTVKYHVRSLLGKLHARDRTQAAIVAVRLGLVSLDSSFSRKNHVLDRRD
jgi:DNA-binding NarL/FixJ family response regulator